MAHRCFSFSRSRLSLASATLLALVACGGGGGGNGGGGFSPIGLTPAPAPAPEPAPAKQNLEITVVDGALGNVTVFLDKNNNGLLDDGEPTGKTNAAGKVTLQIDDADSNKFPVVALVGTDAVDADLGAVAVAYVLKAPADRPGLVSPLTTLVQRVAENTGVSSEEAEVNVRTQLGLAANLFDNYTASTSDRLPATTAAALVQVAQKISGRLAGSVGQPDTSGGMISAGDISKETQNMLVDKLTSIRHILGTPFAVTSCGGGVASDACKQQLAFLADYYASDANENQLTAVTIGSAVGASKQIAAAAPLAEPGTPAASATLDWFSLTDNNNWIWRAFNATAQENAPANGNVFFREVRARSLAGTLSTWGYGGDPTRSGDLHWNGSGWVGCPIGFKSIASVRDARGLSVSDYCDGFNITKSRRVDVDISGRKLADVVNQIKAYPFTTGGPYGSRYSSWGPVGTPAQISASLGNAVFPTGSALRYQDGIETASSIGYDVQESAKVFLYAPAIGAGGDARVNAGVACAVPGVVTAKITTLDQLIASGQGKPCIFGQSTIAGAGGALLPSGPTNEWWSASSVSIGLLGGAPLGTASTATDYYTTNVPIRVSFAGGGSSEVTFHECKQRAIDGSTRNCVAVGTGTYKLTTLADARVMTFTPVPGLASHLSYDRVFIERGGEVFFGFQSKRVAKRQVRLNLEATNALFDAYSKQGVVGLAPITP